MSIIFSSEKYRMQRYKISGRAVDIDDPQFAILLENVYGTKNRPLCLCREPGVEMYVAKMDGRFLCKRMPDSGPIHAPSCDSYEAPPELSGLGQVMGTAIQENSESGVTTLKLGFPLTKSATRAAPVASGIELDSVKTDGNKLTLRGTLNFLWYQAQLNKWSPAMQGKRTWFVVRKYLIIAAKNKIAKGSSLVNILYIPEPFSADRKEDIAQRRASQVMTVATPKNGSRRLMLAIGELKEIAASRYGYKILLRNAPDFPFMVNEDLHKRIKRRFEAELGLWDAMDDVHLMIIGTFGVSATGIASFEEVALITVTEQWLPMENLFDKALIDTMVRDNRRFMTGMRYNLPSTRPLASAVASDTNPDPTAMYIVPPGVSDEYNHALDELVKGSKLASWIWRAGVAGMPSLPR